MIIVVQASLIGSILGNLLLVLGLSLLWGGINHQKQTFNQPALSMSGSLLLMATLAMLIPTAVDIGGGDSDSITQLSRYASLVLLAMYGLALLFQLKTHSHMFVSDEAVEHEGPTMTNKDAWTLLILATVLVAWMAEVLVHSIDSAAAELKMPTLFIGVILLPFFGLSLIHI